MKKERIAGIAPARKLGAMALTLLMLIGMAACGGKKTQVSDETVTPVEEVVAEESAIEEKEAVKPAAEMTTAEDPEAEEAVSAKTSSEDWNKVLDEYEKYCDKTIALAKKAKAGDISAVTEYASLLESAESLQKKLENASSELTAAQAARLQKIAAKMAQSAQSMM